VDEHHRLAAGLVRPLALLQLVLGELFEPPLNIDSVSTDALKRPIFIENKEFDPNGG
jgi:hypothetical protein